MAQIMVTLTRLSVHPFAAVWSTTQTWNLVLIIFEVELIVIRQLKTAIKNSL